MSETRPRRSSSSPATRTRTTGRLRRPTAPAASAREDDPRRRGRGRIARELPCGRDPALLADEVRTLAGLGVEARGQRYHYLRVDPHAPRAAPGLGFATTRRSASRMRRGSGRGSGSRSGPGASRRRAARPRRDPLAAMDVTLGERRYLGRRRGRRSARCSPCSTAPRNAARLLVLWHTDRFDRATAQGWDRLYGRVLDAVRERGGVCLSAGELAARQTSGSARREARPTRRKPGASPVAIRVCGCCTSSTEPCPTRYAFLDSVLSGTRECPWGTLEWDRSGAGGARRFKDGSRRGRRHVPPRGLRDSGGSAPLRSADPARTARFGGCFAPPRTRASSRTGGSSGGASRTPSCTIARRSERTSRRSARAGCSSTSARSGRSTTRCSPHPGTAATPRWDWACRADLPVRRPAHAEAEDRRRDRRRERLLHRVRAARPRAKRRGRAALDRLPAPHR